MLRRIIAVLVIGGFCCTLTACCGCNPDPPVTKDASSNPVEDAKKNGSEFSGKQVEQIINQRALKRASIRPTTIPQIESPNRRGSRE